MIRSALVTMFLWGVFAHPVKAVTMPEGSNIARSVFAAVPSVPATRRDPLVKFKIRGDGWTLSGVTHWSFLQSIFHARFAMGETVEIVDLKMAEER